MSKLFNRDTDLLDKMYRGYLLTYVFVSLGFSLSSLIDSIVAANFLGTVELAALGMINPFIIATSMSVALFNIGAQVLCLKALSKNNRDEANEWYSLVIKVGIIFGVVLSLIIIIFASNIASIIGASKDDVLLYDAVKQFEYGYALVFPLAIVDSLLKVSLTIAGKRSYISTSTIVYIISDIVFDILLVKVLDLGLLGVGLSTCLCNAVSILYVLFVLSRSKVELHYVKVKIELKKILVIFNYGSAKLIGKTLSIISSILFNSIVLSVGGILAAGTASIVTSINNIFLDIDTGIGNTTSVLSSAISGNDERLGLQRIFKNTMFYGLSINIILSILCFIFAPQIVSIFASNDIQLYENAIKAVRIMVFASPCYSFIKGMYGYIQGLGKNKQSRVMTSVYQLTFMFSFIILGKLIGQTGIWLSYSIGSLLCVIIMTLICIIDQRNLKGSLKDKLLLIPQSMVEKQSRSLLFNISDINDIDNTFIKVDEFCKNFNLDEDMTDRVIVGTKRLLIDIFNENNNKVICNVLIYVETKDDVIIRVLDNGIQVDRTVRNKLPVKEVSYLYSMGNNIVSATL